MLSQTDWSPKHAAREINGVSTDYGPNVEQFRGAASFGDKTTKCRDGAQQMVCLSGCHGRARLGQQIEIVQNKASAQMGKRMDRDRVVNEHKRRKEGGDVRAHWGGDEHRRTRQSFNFTMNVVHLFLN